MSRNISVKAMCLIVHNEKLLVNRGYDKVKKQVFHRLIGGKVDFGERSKDAIKREVKEELNTEINNLEFVTAKEEIFTYNGEIGHEVIFLYIGKITDKDILRKKVIINPDSKEFPAVWIQTAEVLSKKVILYPSFDYQQLLSSFKI